MDSRQWTNYVSLHRLLKAEHLCEGKAGLRTKPKSAIVPYAGYYALHSSHCLHFLFKLKSKIDSSIESFLLTIIVFVNSKTNAYLSWDEFHASKWPQLKLWNWGLTKCISFWFEKQKVWFIVCNSFWSWSVIMNWHKNSLFCHNV